VSGWLVGLVGSICLWLLLHILLLLLLAWLPRLLFYIGIEVAGAPFFCLYDWALSPKDANSKQPNPKGA